MLLVAAAVRADDELKPPLVGMEAHTDAKKIVSVELPVNWQEEGPAPILGGLQRWSGFIQPPKPDGPDGWIEIAVKPAWSRAELALWGVSPGWPGTLQEGTLRRGEGWIEQVRKDDSRQKFFLVRLVERDGRVYEVVAHSHETIFPHFERHFRALLDTFKTLSKPPLTPLPAGFAATVAEGSELWTDTKDKKTLQRVQAIRADVWKAGTKALPGAPALTDPPLLVVCEKEPVYAELTDSASPIRSATSMMNFQLRLVAVRVAGKASASFDTDLQLFSALQFSQYYFGGKSPDWVERGIAVWITSSIASKGKPEKPSAEYVRSAKDAVAASKDTFDVVLEKRREEVAVDDFEHFDMTRYAWHCFFRFGGGAKPYGDRYRRYLDDLRKTGSPDEAKKAWEGVDMARISTEFQTWAAAWR